MKLAPKDFWSLSVREWRALTAGAQPQALARAELETLMKEHPDG